MRHRARRRHHFRLAGGRAELLGIRRQRLLQSDGKLRGHCRRQHDSGRHPLRSHERLHEIDRKLVLPVEHDDARREDTLPKRIRYPGGGRGVFYPLQCPVVRIWVDG